jgi:hypothetical protein
VSLSGLFIVLDMLDYKTPERDRRRINERNAAIRAAGGAEYEKWLEMHRASKKKQRANGRKKYDKRNDQPWKTYICSNARLRARKAGLEATIRPTDLVWPTHCPVLGIELAYPQRNGEGGDAKRPDRPSLDRWDNTKGYVPGNVFVISFRANVLKSNATYDELMRICDYAKNGLYHNRMNSALLPNGE